MAPDRVPPQPHPSRLTDFAGHPLVVSVVPDQPPLVALTAASLARATGAPALYFAHVDTDRYTDEEFPDGTVRHVAIDPDTADDTWQDRRRVLTAQVAAAMEGQGIRWEFRYLAGRVDRSLTHLARAVDAAAFVVGTHVGKHHRISEFVNGSVSVQLSHRQHRPVVVVPLEVVDWEGRAPWE
ncbi:Universal stress family protein [Nostocoides japonicum T1-X7]|uniref:Universal stress family protein n=1 Tax=Nostocoides japonicum T1-X7 TaxID=1194083 RepID=A0A077LVT8_9MICO|nr:universal stress protein [Tetrasphaera japonica]CCH78048.1 Universal stress family protein [Tetrasphaera japonica T1-X7]